MTQVFLAYANETHNFAQRLSADLNNYGIQTILEMNNPSTELLDTCEAMVVLMTEAAMHQENLQNLWAYFLDNDKPLYTLRLQDVNLYYRLKRIQYIDFYFPNTDFEQVYAHQFPQLVDKIHHPPLVPREEHGIEMDKIIQLDRTKLRARRLIWFVGLIIIGTFLSAAGYMGYQTFLSQEFYGGHPSVSPDGKQIIFNGRCAGSGLSETYVMDIDGKNRHRIGDLGLDPVWSPVNDQITYAYGSRVCINDKTGKNETCFRVDDLFQTYYLDWSPDGKQLILAGGYRASADPDDSFAEAINIYVIDKNGKNLEQITPDGIGGSQPSWSPDGTQIAFIAVVNDIQGIYVMNIDDPNSIYLLIEGSGINHPAWSHDGTQMVFDKYFGSNIDIYIMNIDGSNLRKITNHIADDEFPAWTPDNQHILFESDRVGQTIRTTGYSNIYIVNADGSGEPKCLTCSACSFP